MSPTVPPTSVMTTSTSSVGHPADAVLDLVGDVRDDLHGVAEVLAAPLLGDHRGVDLAGGDVGGAVEVDVEEALVVADVQVGLGAVVGDEHLTVLERVHRARVDVQVRVELLHRDPQAPRLEQRAQAGGGEPLAEGGGDTPGDEQMTSGALLHGTSRYMLAPGPRASGPPCGAHLSAGLHAVGLAPSAAVTASP